MIPVLTESRSRGEAESRRLADIVLTTVLLVAIAIVIVGEISTPLFVRHLLVPGFDDARATLTIRLTRLLLIYPLIVAVSSVAMAMLNSRSRFLIPAIGVAL